METGRCFETKKNESKGFHVLFLGGAMGAKPNCTISRTGRVARRKRQRAKPSTASRRPLCYVGFRVYGPTRTEHRCILHGAVRIVAIKTFSFTKFTADFFFTTRSGSRG